MQNRSFQFICRFIFCIGCIPVTLVHAHQSGDHQSDLATAVTEKSRQLVDVYSKNKTLNQQLVFEFDHPKRTKIDFFPLPMHSDIGVTTGFMKDAPMRATHGLLREVLSDAGYLRSQTIQSLEEVLRFSSPNEMTNMRLGDAYSIQFFGEPGLDAPYAIKYEGHHLSLNFTVANGQIRGTPLFIGSNPAEVQIGLHRGLRALAPQEDLTKELISTMNQEQLSAAVRPDADFTVPRGEQPSPGNPRGLAAEKMSGDQKELLRQAILSYASMLHPEIANDELSRIDAAGFENLYFLTNGLTGDEENFHYRIQGPTLLIEFQSMNANHIHCLWRDPATDFGSDLLSRHLTEQH